MKIEWLNDDCTEARLTRGILWRKRVALVSRHETGQVNFPGTHGEYTVNWKFVPSVVWCDRDLDVELDDKRREERTWRKPSAIPPARLLP